MLHFSSRWHFASERDPFREARCLRFAGPNTSGAAPDSSPKTAEEVEAMYGKEARTRWESTPEDGREGLLDSFAQHNAGSPKERQQAEAEAAVTTNEELEKKRILREETEKEQKRTRKKINTVITDEEKNTPEKNAMVLQEKATNLVNNVKNIYAMFEEDAVKQYVKANNLQGEREEYLSFWRKEVEKAEKIRGKTDDFAKWQKGNLDINTFIEDIKIAYAGQEGAEEIIQKLEKYRTDNKDKIDNAPKIFDPEDTYENITRWESGKSIIRPAQFVQVIRNFYGPNPDPDQKKRIKKMEEYIELPEIKEASAEWDDGNVGEATLLLRKQIIKQLSGDADTVEIKRLILENRKAREEVEKIANLKEMLATVADNVAGKSEAVLKVEKLFREMSERMVKDYEVEHSHGSFEIFNVKFYSAFQVWEALKQVKEAYVTAWHEGSHHKSAEFAKGIGAALEWVPFIGTDANISLKKAQDSHNEKAKNEFKDYLKSEKFTFSQLFEDGDNQLHLNHHDPNKVRAILEYAASRGWLYDLDLSAGESIKKVIGHNLAELLKDYDEKELLNYFDTLRGENSGGRDAEIEASYKKVKNIENIPFFISEIEREMNDSNLWAAVGIAKRAVERGLEGEVIPWVMTTVMRVLRNNRPIRERASVDFFDKLGELSLYHSDSTLGSVKAHRKEYYKWSQHGSDENLETVGMMPSVVKDIENEIRTKTGMSFEEPGKGENSQYKLDRYVAQMLATQPVEINGHQFSIFTDRYKYFTYKELGQGEVDVGKEDEDYYREIAGNHRADTIVFKKIFGLTGSGQLTYESRASFFAKNMFNMPGDLESRGLADAKKNYLELTGKKMQHWMKVWLSDTRSEPVAEIIINGRYFCKELIKKGFVDISIIEKAIIQGWGGDKLAKKILRQVKPNSPLLEGSDDDESVPAAEQPEELGGGLGGN
jgi:hypothetical protein